MLNNTTKKKFREVAVFLVDYAILRAL